MHGMTSLYDAISGKGVENAMKLYQQMNDSPEYILGTVTRKRCNIIYQTNIFNYPQNMSFREYVFVTSFYFL